MPLPMKEDELKCITRKVYSLYAVYGFDGISMDEVSRRTGISKATLYRYFTSKEDIVKSMVDFLIFHFDSVRFKPIEKIGDVVDNTAVVYRKFILITALSGLEFLRNLEKKFPSLYESYRAALEAMQGRFLEFFRQAVQRGYCRDVMLYLVGKQFRYMLTVIINMDDLEKHQISLTEAIKEYYRMFLYQILREEFCYVAEEEKTYDFAEDLADVLKNDFFLDSIRR